MAQLNRNCNLSQLKKIFFKYAFKSLVCFTLQIKQSSKRSEDTGWAIMIISLAVCAWSRNLTRERATLDRRWHGNSVAISVEGPRRRRRNCPQER